jgi:hypothetical protein
MFLHLLLVPQDSSSERAGVEYYCIALSLGALQSSRQILFLLRWRQDIETLSWVYANCFWDTHFSVEHSSQSSQNQYKYFIIRSRILFSFLLFLFPATYPRQHLWNFTFTLLFSRMCLCFTENFVISKYVRQRISETHAIDEKWRRTPSLSAYDSIHVFVLKQLHFHSLKMSRIKTNDNIRLILNSHNNLQSICKLLMFKSNDSKFF